MTRPRLGRRAVGVAVGLAVLVLTPFVVVQGVGRAHVADPGDVPTSDAIVVPGREISRILRASGLRRPKHLHGRG